MLWESVFWKKDLLKVAAKLEKRMQSNRWTRRSAATIQQEIFWAVFAIRRLSEADTLPADLLNTGVELLSYREISDDDKMYDYDKFHLHYELKNPKRYVQRYDLVMQSIIHSYYFTLVYKEKYLQGIGYCSERRRDYFSILLMDNFLTMIRDAAAPKRGPEYKAFRLTMV